MTDSKLKILWIDSLVDETDALASRLSQTHQLIFARSLDDGEKHLRRPGLTAVLLSLDPENGAGLESLREIRQKYPWTELIALTTRKSVEQAVRAVKEGALDYLHREQDQRRLFELLHQIADVPEKDLEIDALRSDLVRGDDYEICIGKSPLMKKVCEVLDRIAPLQTTALLLGESGTGKEILARYIHRKSHLHDKPFVTVNLPSIPSNLVESVLFGHERGSFTSAHRRHYGKFELADGGTIFLDEIGDLHLDVQSKLLRVIQESEIEPLGGRHPIRVNVRLIAASKTDLKQAVKSGRFRDDLYYRLNVVPVTLPPLRKRLEDLPELCELFIRRYAQKFDKRANRLKPDALNILKTYRWPGNIRELENLIERMVAIMDSKQVDITKEDIPLEYYMAQMSDGSPNTMILDDALVQYERNLIVKALKQNNWSRKKTAEALGISYGILKYKVRKFNIEIPGRTTRTPASLTTTTKSQSA